MSRAACRLSIRRCTCAGCYKRTMREGHHVPVARIVRVVERAAVDRVHHDALPVPHALAETAVVHGSVRQSVYASPVLQAILESAVVGHAVWPSQLAPSVQFSVAEFARVCCAARERERAVAGESGRRMGHACAGRWGEDRYENARCRATGELFG
jgi:hypothetical protein